MKEQGVLVIGAGRMGFGVIKTLLGKGYNVTVSDPSSEAVAAATHLGAKESEDFNESVTANKVIILSLPGPAQVTDVINNITEVQATHHPFIIDLSTIDPQTAMEAGEKCEENGMSYIEAPVSGGPGGAEAGTLAIMVGAAEDDFKQISPMLHDIGKNIFYLGEIGTGSITKICNNIVVAATASVLSEAFILASAGGIEPKKLKEVLDQSVGASNTLNVFGEHFITGDFSNPTFALEHMHKDVGLFAEAAKQYGLTSLVGTLATQIYNGAYAQGYAKEDHTAVCKFLEQVNNKKIKRSV